MLQYTKIDVSEEVHINKKKCASKECILCRYWHFKNNGFEFKLSVCNKSHDALMTVYKFKNIAILPVKRVDYGCILWGISKNKVVNILSNSVLEDKCVL